MISIRRKEEVRCRWGAKARPANSGRFRIDFCEAWARHVGLKVVAYRRVAIALQVARLAEVAGLVGDRLFVHLANPAELFL